MATLRRAAAAGFLGRMLDEGDDAVGRHSLADMLYPMAVADEALVLGSEQLAVRSLADPSHVAAWVGEPRVFIVTVGQDPADLDALDLGTDLLLDGVHVLAATEGDASSAAQRSLWYGALEAALETEHLLGRLATLPEPPLLDGASLAMARADLVVTDDPDGTLRVTPGDPATSTTWWSVDPATGATRAVLAPGMGGVNGKVAWGKIKHQPPRINRGGAGGANTHGLTKDGRIVRLRDPGDPSPAGPPPSRCGAGQEYVAIVGCVSVPAAWAIRVGVGMAVTLGAYLASLALQSAMQDAAGP